MEKRGLKVGTVVTILSMLMLFSCLTIQESKHEGDLLEQCVLEAVDLGYDYLGLLYEDNYNLDDFSCINKENVTHDFEMYRDILNERNNSFISISALYNDYLINDYQNPSNGKGVVIEVTTLENGEDIFYYKDFPRGVESYLINYKDIDMVIESDGYKETWAYSLKNSGFIYGFNDFNFNREQHFIDIQYHSILGTQPSKIVRMTLNENLNCIESIALR